MSKTNQLNKTVKKIIKTPFKEDDYKSNDGMLTTV